MRFKQLSIIISFICVSCIESKIIYKDGSINLKNSENSESEKTKNNDSSGDLTEEQPDPSSYIISAPSVLFANIRDNISYTLTRTSGSEALDYDKLNLVSLGSVNCQGFSASNIETNNPIITISACSGIGFVAIEYGDERSPNIPINGNFSIHLGNISSIAVDKENSLMYLKDNTNLYSLNQQTGALIKVAGNDLGAGPSLSFSSRITYHDGYLYTVKVVEDELLKIDVTTGNRTIISSDTIGTGPTLSNSQDIVINSLGTIAFIADATLDAIFSVDLATGNRSILSDNTPTGSGPSFNSLRSLEISSDDSTLFVMDYGADAVLSVDTSSGNRTIISRASTRGDGVGIVEGTSIALSPDEQTIYINDTFKNAIFLISRSTGDRTIIADSGDGIGSGFDINKPIDIATMSDENKLYYSNESSSGVFYVNLQNLNRNITFSSIVGSGPPIDGYGLMLDSSNEYAYIVNGRIIRVHLESGERVSLVSSSTGSGPGFVETNGMCFNSDLSIAYVTEDFQNIILRTDMSTGNRTILSGNGNGTGDAIGQPYSLICPSSPTEIYYSDGSNRAVYSVDTTNGNRTEISGSGRGTGVTINSLGNITLSPDESSIYYNDRIQNALVKIDIASGDRTIVSNNSTGTGPSLDYASGLAINSDETSAYLLEYIQNAIIHIDIASGDRTIISSDSVGSGPSYRGTIRNLTINSDNTLLYAIIDSGLVEIDIATGNRIFISR